MLPLGAPSTLCISTHGEEWFHNRPDKDTVLCDGEVVQDQTKCCEFSAQDAGCGIVGRAMNMGPKGAWDL